MGKNQNRSLLLKKHTATIHCANTLSLLQRKISNALLFAAYDTLLIQEVHQISIRDLCNLIGYNGNNYPVIKSALRQLVATQIEWNLIDDIGEAEWTASTILASVQLKGAECFYAYSPHMKQLLHSPQIYGVINLAIQSKFKSAYSLALYENVARYKNLPNTKWFDINLFRQLMGVPEDQYLIFRDFKRRVLTQSVKEVNAFSDLIIESEIKRSGREVKAIRFKIENRKSVHAVGKTENALTENSVLAARLAKDFGLTKAQIHKVISQYSEATIIEKINIIENLDVYKKGKIKNLAAYLIQALKDNYQSAISSNVVQLRQKHVKDLAESVQEQQRLHLEESKQAYESYVNELVKDFLVGLTVDEYQGLEQGFLECLNAEKNTVALKLYNQHKLKHVASQAMFNLYVRQHHFDMLGEVSTFEDFLADNDLS